MKKLKFALLAIPMSALVLGQVGINETAPKATLDIQKGTNPNTPQGVLVPRLTNEDIKAMEENLTEESNGLIVYMTEENKERGIRDKGLYKYKQFDLQGYGAYNVYEGLPSIIAKMWTPLESSGLQRVITKTSTGETTSGWRLIGKSDRTHPKIGQHAIDFSDNYLNLGDLADKLEGLTPENLSNFSYPELEQILKVGEGIPMSTNVYYDSEGNPVENYDFYGVKVWPSHLLLPYALDQVSEVGNEDVLGGPSVNYGASGDYSLAAGLLTRAEGRFSTALGLFNIAKGQGNFLSGASNYSSGEYTSILGRANVSYAPFSLISGYNNKVWAGDTSFVVGEHNRMGYHRRQEASNKNISGYIMGRSNVVSAKQSFVFGENIEVVTNNSFTFGRYNTKAKLQPSESFEKDHFRLFTISNGTGRRATERDPADRSDAYTVLRNAKVGIDIDNFETTKSDAKLQVNGAIKIGTNGETNSNGVYQDNIVLSCNKENVGTIQYIETDDNNGEFQGCKKTNGTYSWVSLTL